MSIFKFKHFNVIQADSAMKIGTDAMVFGAIIDTEGKKSALDIGAGTGVLSLMAAQQNQELKIIAVEIEAKAAAEARQNFQNSPFHNQLQLLHADFLQMEGKNQFDVIFSNPPYFENSSKSTVGNRNLARHDDNLPLNLLFQKVSALLSENGNFWLILPHLTMDQYYAEAISNELYPETEICIFGKKDQLVRKITSFSKARNNLVQTELIIRNSDGTYTDEYKKLTQEFHFNVLK